MKDDDGLPTSTTTTSSKKENVDSSFLGKGRYKFWALAAILLLAFWSMFTGTVSLRWSGNLNSLSTDLDTPIHDDLDVLVSLIFLQISEIGDVICELWLYYVLFCFVCV